MRRYQVADAGARYACRVPLARSLDADEESTLTEAVRAAFTTSNYNETLPDVETVRITDDRLTAIVSTSVREAPTPGEILSMVTRAVAEWHSTHAPIGVSTRVGGEQSIATLDAAPLSLDRDAPEPAEQNTYAIVYPERPLTPEEITGLEYGLSDSVTVAERYLIVPNAKGLVRNTPGRRVAARLSSRPHSRLSSTPLTTPAFYREMELGTLATVDDVALDALERRAKRDTPHAEEPVDAGEVSS